MSIGLALLVSADPATIQQFSLALRELSISPDACQDAASAGLLLKRRKFNAVIVDFQLGEQSGHILDEARLSPSNRTAVTFGIGDKMASYVGFPREISVCLRETAFCAVDPQNPQVCIWAYPERTETLFPLPGLHSGHHPEPEHAGSSLFQP